MRRMPRSITSSIVNSPMHFVRIILRLASIRYVTGMTRLRQKLPPERGSWWRPGLVRLPRGLEYAEQSGSAKVLGYTSALVLLAVVFIAVLLPPVLAAELSIQRKVKITPLAYVFEVVASYYETVSYELQIQVDKHTYFTDYTPDIQPNWPLPGEWEVNHPIAVCTEKHRLFVKLTQMYV